MGCGSKIGVEIRTLLSFLLLFNLSSATLLMGVVGNTGSMIPTYRGGEKVLLMPTAYANPGDIIVFEKNDSLIIHRVIFEFRGCYITKGDATWLPDWGCAQPKYVVVA
ncbi:S26 family signal peptidase [Candidatus Micrarchaeota archaeon]|nr:S26 family signal peptidase [Candidatus Micrarchaeota archaeon]